VVSAVGGQFGLLHAALQNVGFERSRDRLIGVGDVLGPSPESADAADWIQELGLATVVGKEEAAILEWVRDPSSHPEVATRGDSRSPNGRAWLYAARTVDLARCVLRLREMPLLIQVLREHGDPVAVVHGELPLGVPFNRLHALLERERVRQQIIFGRRRALACFRASQENRVPPERITFNQGMALVVASAPPSGERGVGNTYYLAPDADGSPSIRLLDALVEGTAQHAYFERASQNPH